MYTIREIWSAAQCNDSTNHAKPTETGQWTDETRKVFLENAITSVGLWFMGGLCNCLNAVKVLFGVDKKCWLKLVCRQMVEPSHCGWIYWIFMRKVTTFCDGLISRFIIYQSTLSMSATKFNLKSNVTLKLKRILSLNPHRPLSRWKSRRSSMLLIITV